MRRRYCEVLVYIHAKGDKNQYTSGYPSSSLKSPGTELRFLVALPACGGEGFAVYSVRDMPLMLDEGVCRDFVPLVNAGVLMSIDVEVVEAMTALLTQESSRFPIYLVGRNKFIKQVDQHLSEPSRAFLVGDLTILQCSIRLSRVVERLVSGIEGR
jgi:hypothetical protein